MHNSASDRDFLDRWSQLKSSLLLQDNANIVNSALVYIETNKIPHRERFASYATSKFYHFGHTSTSRAEGAHWSNLKVHLKRSRGSLLGVYDRIVRSTENRLHTITDKINRERIEIMTLPIAVFGPVLRGITHYALKHTCVFKQYRKALHPIASTCNNYYKCAYGIPCAHIIQERLQSNSTLMMKDFHIHWYKEQLDFDRDVIVVQDPLLVERYRGRPTHTRATKRNSSQFELVQTSSRQSKCSMWRNGS